MTDPADTTPTPRTLERRAARELAEAKAQAIARITWVIALVAALISVVLLAIFSDGSHVDAVLAFMGGLLLPGMPGGRTALTRIVGGALLLVALVGCGAASAEQRTAYAVEQARCLANERTIVDRPDTSYELDRYDLEQERARCDAALLAIYGGP